MLSTHSRLCLPLLFFFLSAQCLAHDTGSSYLKLTVQENRMIGRWEIALHDLQDALKLDANGDGAVNLEELRTQYPLVTDYAISRLKVTADDALQNIRIENKELTVEKLSNGTNLVLNFAINDMPTPTVVEIEYRLFFELKPQHRGLLLLEYAGRNYTAMFSPDRPIQRFELGTRRPGHEFLGFGWEGIWHIWIGFDHILFLLALLLPAVLKRKDRTWRPVAGFRHAFLNVFKIVTAFTLAHSVTLSLAALELVKLPSRWVESAIAASVLLAALNNLRPFVRERAWLVAFGFGLVHGFGFASVLIELGLPRDALVLALVGFNLGVEVGQLAIVTVFLPAAYGLRGSWFYRTLILQFGSVLIAGVAGLWIAERMFDLNLIGVTLTLPKRGTAAQRQNRVASSPGEELRVGSYTRRTTA